MKRSRPHDSERLLSTLLSLALLLSPHPASAAPGDIAATTMGGLTNALNSVNGAFLAVGASNTQLNQLATQLAMVQQQVAGAPTQQSQLDLLKQQLLLAQAEAQNCVQMSMRSYQPYYTKHPEAGAWTVTSITSMEPNCETYGALLDAIATNKAKMEDVNKKMSCLSNLQNKVSQLAEAAKAPFSTLHNSAVEVYKTHSQLIDAHTKMAEKLDLELNGKEGKGGYRESVAKLKQMSFDLNNVLNAKSSEGKDGMKLGLVKQVNDLRDQRVKMANKWYYTLMQEVESCYQSRPMPCLSNQKVVVPAPQCIAVMIQNMGGKQPSAVNQGRKSQDMASLQNIGLMNALSAEKINLAGNLDIAKPATVLAFTKKRFDETLRSVLSTYRSHKFAMPVDRAALGGYVQKAYQFCYERASANFATDLESSGSAGGKYYSNVTEMQDSERQAANDIKNWMDRVEGEMSSFNTAFKRNYNSELAQFKGGCTATEDPYQSLDCLRQLNATLSSGLSGVSQTTKLANGQSYTANPTETVLPMQTLTLDAAGKPSIGSAQATCLGFDDCISVLDNRMSGHLTAKQKGEDDRVKFVQQHNAAVRSTFDLVAAQFTQMSQLLVAGVADVNDRLGQLAIGASVRTKEADSKPLEEDGKVGEDGQTGMIKVPDKMKEAIAAQRGFTEIDVQSLTDVTQAYNTNLNDMNRKATEAQRMKQNCRVSKAEYDALANINCNNAKNVCTGGITAAAGRMDSLFRRGQVLNDPFERSSGMSEYNSCRREIMSENRQVENYSFYNRPVLGRGEKDTEDRPQVSPQELRERKRENRREATEECEDILMTSLGGPAGNGRKGLNGTNMGLLSRLQNLSQACAGSGGESDSDSEDESEDKGGRFNSGAVKSACESFRAAAKAATPPANEDETNYQGGAAMQQQNSVVNPLTMPGVTLPAR